MLRVAVRRLSSSIGRPTPAAACVSRNAVAGDDGGTTAFGSCSLDSHPFFHFQSRATKSLSTISSPELRHFSAPIRRSLPWILPCSAFHSLTDTRFPKRRPTDKPRRKRSSLKPPGPYAWVKCVPGELILPIQPNEGSVKRRNEKKRIKQHRSFIMSEKRKRKAELQEAKRKKMMKRVDRKMAAVARERAWAERLVELKQIEEEKKKAAMA